MLIRRVVLGASIVGVVGAAVALTVLALGTQVGSGSVASSDPDVVPSASGAATTMPDDTVPTIADPPATQPPDTEPPDMVPPATDPRDTEPRDTEPPDTVAAPTVAPATTVVPEATFEFADASTCPATGRAAVVDRENQRAWLCADGLVTREMPITSAWIQPDPGDYAIYAKDMNSSSRFTDKYSTMTHFVAFTHGKIRGARIAFHSMPVYSDGSFVQPLETLGVPEQRGNSAGCIRVSPTDAELIWSSLEIGDLVRVVS
jgi:L,D-transpeptidase catalytic domain